MKKELIAKPKYDVVFKLLLTRNEALLKDLLSKTLGIQADSIKGLEYLNPEILPEDISGKSIRLDIRVKFLKTFADIEMQVGHKDGYEDRSLVYQSKQISNALESGDEYSALPKCIHISFVNFNMFSWEKYHSVFMPIEIDEHKPLTDKSEMHFFELPKISNEGKTDLELWLRLLKAETEEELDAIAKTGGDIMVEAVNTVRHLGTESRTQQLIRAREDARIGEIIYRGALLKANTEAVTEAVTKSVTEAVTKSVTETVTEAVTKANKEEFARKLLNIGMDISSISKLSELPEDVIRTFVE